MAFGADQLDKETPDSERIFERFFNWYYASTAMSVVIALTIMVYIQDHLGWNFGFGVLAILMFFSAFMFLFGSSLYVKVKPSSSLFTGFVQVPLVAFKNRHLNPPPADSNEYYHHSDDKKLAPTNKLRYCHYLHYHHHWFVLRTMDENVAIYRRYFGCRAFSRQFLQMEVV